MLERKPEVLKRYIQMDSKKTRPGENMKNCDNCQHQNVCMIFIAIEDIILNSYKLNKKRKSEVYRAVAKICEVFNEANSSPC